MPKNLYYYYRSPKTATKNLLKNPRLLVLVSPRYERRVCFTCGGAHNSLKKPVSDADEEDAEAEEKPKKKAAPRKKPESKAKPEAKAKPESKAKAQPKAKAEAKPKAKAAPKKKAAKKVC